MTDLQYPGQHEFDGLVCADRTPAAGLTKIRDEMVYDSSDIVISTYPKSGTTWLQEILYSILEGSEKAKERTQCMDVIFPFLEFDPLLPGVPSHYERLSAAPPPRLIKTHLTARFFERALRSPADRCPKFIVVVRNPKDTLTSFYHFHKLMVPEFHHASWDAFFQLFKKDKLIGGNICDHHAGWWAHRHRENVLFLQYETMLADSARTIQQVADFIGRPISDDELSAIVEDSSFKSMQSRGFASYHGAAAMVQEGENKFFRKGKKGDWQSIFSAEQNEYVDDLIKTRVTPIGLSYEF